MITKETFCKVISLIKEQDQINRVFTEALYTVGDGPFAFGTNNRYLDALLLVLTEELNDKSDYIGWWLFEDIADRTVWSADEKQKWVLDTPEQLYDFLVNVP